MKTTAYLSLGSNLGDRAGNLRQAIERLKSLGTVAAISSFYETEPVEVADEQPWYVNCAVALETDLLPEQLLAGTLDIERGMGRRRDSAKASRTLDIDIVIFGETILNTAELTIPHAGMERRRFVLEPLAEIAPHAGHPVLHRSVGELLRALPAGEGEVRRLETR